MRVISESQPPTLDIVAESYGLLWGENTKLPSQPVRLSEQAVFYLTKHAEYDIIMKINRNGASHDDVD